MSGPPAQLSNTEIKCCRDAEVGKPAANLDTTRRPPKNARTRERPADAHERTEGRPTPMTVRRNERPPAPRPPRARPTQVVIVHDLQEGDYLPDYGSTVRAVDVRTERLGIEWVDLQLTDQRQLTLDGHNDIAAIPAMVESTPSGRR